MHIGITLLFCKKNNTIYKGLQSSYILRVNDYSDFYKKSESLIKKLLKIDFSEYQYLGVMDLYFTEKEGVGRYLGRTSFFDFKQIESANELILSKKKVNRILNLNSKSIEKFNLGLVYYNTLDEYTMIVYSQINSKYDYDKIIKISKRIRFKKKIVEFDLKATNINTLEFIGISDLYRIKNKGLFELMGNFSLKKLKDEILQEKELKKKFLKLKAIYQQI